MRYALALKKLTTPKEWNDYYYQEYGSFRVQLFHHRPQKWDHYTPAAYPKNVFDFPNHRERFVDELIVDVDGKKPDSTTHAYPVFKRFQERNLECSLWASGGDGYHLHVFFPELRTMMPEDRRLMLEALKKVVLKGLIRPVGLDSHICGGKPTLYQVEGGHHRKGGSKHLKAKHITEAKNKIPSDVWQTYHAGKTRAVKDAKKQAAIKKTVEAGGVPAFIKYFESERYYDLNDGKKRAAFIMASYYGMKEPTREYVLSKLREWNSYTLRDNLDEHTIQGVVRSVMRYHDNGGIRPPFRFAKDLLEELGRSDVWEKTLQEETANGIGGNN